VVSAFDSYRLSKLNTIGLIRGMWLTMVLADLAIRDLVSEWPFLVLSGLGMMMFMWLSLSGWGVKAEGSSSRSGLARGGQQARCRLQQRASINCSFPYIACAATFLFDIVKRMKKDEVGPVLCFSIGSLSVLASFWAILQSSACTLVIWGFLQLVVGLTLKSLIFPRSFLGKRHTDQAH
jgi:hypothetical protein